MIFSFDFLDGLDVETSPALLAWAWPIWVASSFGRYLRSCLVVKAGNGMRYPADTDFARVARAGENRLVV